MPKIWKALPKIFLILFIFLTFTVGCQPNTPTPVVVQPAAPEIVQPEAPAVTPTTDFSVALQTPRPYPNQYCSQQKASPLAAAPEPFLYLPFNGTLTDDTWSSQMDHDRPDYTRNGRLSALGEIGQFDRHDAEYPGGTIALNAPDVFDYQTSIQTIEAQGYRILAYRLPLSEQFAFYDGHDGHDFAASGSALAAGDGVILFKGAVQNSLGNVIEIFHPQGYVTRYAHLMNFAPGIEAGSEVHAGDLIGQIGGSGYSNGQWNDNLWNVHLHFTVFRWDQSSNTWVITDPFGWDPWAGPDMAARLQAQQEDPLVACNGEVSYDLWVDFWPHNIGGQSTSQAFLPGNDRYLGGYYYDEPVQPTATLIPSATPMPPTATPSPSVGAISGVISPAFGGGELPVSARVFAHNLETGSFYWNDINRIDGVNYPFEFYNLPIGPYQIVVWFDANGDFPPMGYVECSFIQSDCQTSPALKTIMLAPDQQIQDILIIDSWMWGTDMSLWQAEPLP